jgi:hypothetical protein
MFGNLMASEDKGIERGCITVINFYSEEIPFNIFFSFFPRFKILNHLLVTKIKQSYATATKVAS